MALAALALGLGGCEGRAKADAAESAERLLAAAEAGDRIAFEAEIDRRAVREDVRRQIIDLARETGVEVDGGPSDFALDRMIGPDAIRVVRAGPAQPMKDRLKMTGGKACLPGEGGGCLLTFAKEKHGEKSGQKDRWRLVGMQAMDLTVEVAEAGD